MEKLAHYDPYTINEVEFFVQKKTKYTTLKSIILSLVILALTVLLNIKIVKHLWISRSQLDIVSSERRMSKQPFTSGYVCIIAKTLSNPLPNTTLFTTSLSTSRTTKNFALTDNFDTQPQILYVANGRDFGCYDIEGAILNDDSFLKMTIDGADDTFDFMYKVYTPGEIMKEESSNYVYYENVGGGQFLNLIMKVKKIHGLVYDSLLVNYQPQEIFGLSPTRILVVGISGLSQSTLTFQTEFDKPYDTTTEYVLQRANIGEILGKLLSWFSIFVLIAAFVITPIIDYNYKVQLCKKLYDNPKLNAIQLSIFSYIKYLISKIKKNLFDEEVLSTTFEHLEKDIDLLNLIKKQAMMKKLVKENQYINLPLNQSSQTVILDDNTENMIELFIKKEQPIRYEENLQGTPQNDNINANRGKQQILQTPLVTEPDEEAKDNCFKSLFKSLDASETSISLICNKGQGYKNRWNVILTLVAVGVVFWFILFAGLFEMSPTYTFSSVLVDENDSIIPSITINPEDILFRAIRTSPAYNYVLSAVILDGHDQIIQNLTLLTGAACDKYKQNLNQTTAGWFCLNKSINLRNGINDKTKLGLRLTYLSLFAFSITNIEILYWQYTIVNSQIVKDKLYTKYLYSTSQLYRFDGQAIMYKNQQNQLAYPEGINLPSGTNPTGFLWTCNKAQPTPNSIFKGITFEITGEFIKLKKDTPSIWDVIDTAWGIVVLSFSVLLSKITRYLNVRERQKIIKGQQNENRNDIVAIISTQYKLIYQVFYKELQQVKYFYKTKFEDFGAKER